MKYITLDFTGCRYLGEIYRIIKKEFEFAENHGENLDALWDSLRYYWDENLHVYIKGFKSLPKEFDDYMRKILGVFDKVHETIPTITFEIVS